jgi:hypothetical protein
VRIIRAMVGRSDHCLALLLTCASALELCRPTTFAAGGEKRRKPYFRFDARAAFDVAMVTG